MAARSVASLSVACWNQHGGDDLERRPPPEIVRVTVCLLESSARNPTVAAIVS
jgi:hypothetical protein